MDETYRARTKIETRRYKLEWIIDDFSVVKAQCKTSKEYISPVYTLGSRRWRLVIKFFPTIESTPPESQNSPEFLSIFIKFDRSNNEHTTAWFVIRCLGEVNSDHEPIVFNPSSSWGWKQFLDVKDIPDNVTQHQEPLKINAELFVVENQTEEVEEQMSPEPPRAVGGSPVTKHLWESKYLADVIVHCGDRQFEAHKCILGAASPMLRAMFEHGMVENLKNELKIDHRQYNHHIVYQFLQYIYLNEFPKALQEDLQKENINNILPLLKMADQYRVNSLGMRCLYELGKRLSPANAVAVLLSSLHYEPSQPTATPIKERALNYIARNFSTLHKRPSFKELKANPEATELVFAAMAELQEKSRKRNFGNSNTEPCLTSG